jgi:hypothetical protein
MIKVLIRDSAGHTRLYYSTPRDNRREAEAKCRFANDVLKVIDDGRHAFLVDPGKSCRC